MAQDGGLDSSSSVWIADLREGDEEAARKLWERFHERVVQLAKRQLGNRRRVSDEEDVALSVIDAVCRGAQEGRFPELQSGEELWRLLVSMTRRKVIDKYRYESRKKRQDAALRGESIWEVGGDEQRGGINEVAGRDEAPSFIVELREEHLRLLELLPSDSLRRVAHLKMLGCTNDEIATELGVLTRTVERKLQVIRRRWSKEVSRMERDEED